MTAFSLPALSSDTGLVRYLQEINAIPFLEEGEEYSLAKTWREGGDVKAAHRLVTSHLKLVAKIAMGFRGYGLPVMELISEGNIGLMQAVKRFDPDRGFRLSTYAMWWIKASIQEYVLRSWSLVKIGTTAAQKRLFFNLRKVKRKINAADDANLLPSDVSRIAHELNVSEDEVKEMNTRLSGGDHYLNDSIGGDENGGEWIDFLEESSENQEMTLLESQESNHKTALLANAMNTLNDRERHIIHQRHLAEPAATLEDLSQHYGISRERIRQIEARAMEKLQSGVKGLLPAA